MAQSRPQYVYNPDLPVRKWHQKWIHPLISLQNAPPTSHGTPAPTKEDGEVGHAGFKIRTWIPMDEDEDVSEETLQQEVDWWNKPGAPVRPEISASSEMPKANSVPPVVLLEKTDDEAMQIDQPAEDAPTENGVAKHVEHVAAVSPTSEPPKQPSPPGTLDTEMPDAQLSPAPPSPVSPLLSSPQVHISSPQAQHKSPPPLLAQTTDSVESQKSPSNPAISPATNPTEMEDILQSKPSPPSDPFAQENEAEPGLPIETVTEEIEQATDPANVIHASDEIAGDGIAGAGTEDLDVITEIARERAVEPRTEEEEKVLEEFKEDFDTEIVKEDS